MLYSELFLCLLLTEYVSTIITPNILGGRNATPGEFYAMVGIIVRTSANTRHLCGGTLINLKNVITAAHCTHELYPDKVS